MTPEEMQVIVKRAEENIKTHAVWKDRT